MLVLSNVIMKSSNVRKKEKKKKGTPECDKSTFTYDFGIAQCDNETIKCEKKIKVPPNVTKEQSNVILVLPNVRKKIKVSPNATKVWPNMILVLPYITMKLSNVRNKLRYP